MTTTPPTIQLKKIHKTFNKFVTLDQVTLNLHKNTILTLLKPSNYNKTTLLHLISNFKQPNTNTIKVHKHHVTSPTSIIPPKHHHINLIFQNLTLFPHLTTQQNITYNIQHNPNHNIHTNKLLNLIKLHTNNKHIPHKLSNNIQQHITLTQTITPHPNILLLNKPFSNLDQTIQTQLHKKIHQILHDTHQNTIFITHDQTKTLTITNNVTIMTHKQILQITPPKIIYTKPTTPYITTFINISNLIPTKLHNNLTTTHFKNIPLIKSSTTLPNKHTLYLLQPKHFSMIETTNKPTSNNN